MKRSIRHVALYSATLAGLLTLSACGKHEQAPPANAPAAPASTPAAQQAPTPAPAPASTAPAAPAPASTTTTKPAGAGASASATPAAVNDNFHVAAVTLGSKVANDLQISEAKNRFAPNEKAIYASVATQGDTAGATLNATWTYLEGQARQITSTNQSIATNGPATTTFEIRNPNLWPAGKYQVVISLDGKPVTTQDFEVSKS
ncbi:hypothetical protein [Dyella subtropica]|uniref:hypothetical protein n=1 Tax=Dyella subtropica TaxID=2992127 RepID=UPI0022547BCA|nr:hypothetical protein [Dyella subtropica]